MKTTAYVLPTDRYSDIIEANSRVLLEAGVNDEMLLDEAFYIANCTVDCYMYSPLLEYVLDVLSERYSLDLAATDPKDSQDDYIRDILSSIETIMHSVAEAYKPYFDEIIRNIGPDKAEIYRHRRGNVVSVSVGPVIVLEITDV